MIRDALLVLCIILVAGAVGVVIGMALGLAAGAGGREPKPEPPVDLTVPRNTTGVRVRPR